MTLFTMVHSNYCSIQYTKKLYYLLILSSTNYSNKFIERNNLIVEIESHVWCTLETWAGGCPACILFTSLKTWCGSTWSLLHCSSSVAARCLQGLVLISGCFSYLIGNVLLLSLGVNLVLLFIGIIPRRKIFLWIWDSNVAIKRSLFVSTLTSPSPEMRDSEVLHEL